MNAIKYTFKQKHKDIGIRTVVNKVGVVENEFRVLPMELLAGDPTTMVEVLECGCKFSFDFKEVFWNSRLQGEHNRIVGVMKVDDIVCTSLLTNVQSEFMCSMS